jgi:hypothetical protein
MPLLLFVCLSAYGARADSNIMTNPVLLATAKTEKEIEQWGKERFGLAPVEKYELKGQQVLVLLGDVGSGLALRVIYVYVRTPEAWRLIAVRFTNTSDVKVVKSAGALVFKSKAGKELLSLPAEGLPVTFDPAEQ